MIYYNSKLIKEVNLLYWKIALTMLFVLLIYLYIQNYLHKTTHYKIFIPKLDRTMKNKKIVFISDTHFRDTTSLSFIDRVLIDIEKMNPDLILFGGDIVHELTGVRILEQTKDFFFQLNKLAPSYLVYGNHDMATNRLNEIESMLNLAGVKLLNNEAEWISFENPSKGFWLLGLNDSSSEIKKKEEPLSKIAFPANGNKEVKILLAHHPKFFEKYLRNAEKRPNLVLSGHSHGGQIILPIVGGLFAPGQGKLPKYDFGMFTSKNYADSRMIVTKGLGNSQFPLRINNRPEIVLIEFE